jgi:hypothetical protein
MAVSRGDVGMVQRERAVAVRDGVGRGSSGLACSGEGVGQHAVARLEDLGEVVDSAGKPASSAAMAAAQRWQRCSSRGPTSKRHRPRNARWSCEELSNSLLGRRNRRWPRLIGFGEERLDSSARRGGKLWKLLEKLYAGRPMVRRQRRPTPSSSMTPAAAFSILRHLQ